MKKNFLLVIGAAMMLAISVGSCSNDDNGFFKVRNVSNSGCKSATRAEGDGEILIDRYETIEVKGLKDGFLSINHENAMFNCAAGQLTIQAVIEDNVIKIMESESDSEIKANCICPYDLYCEVGPLEEGVEYTIVVFENGAEYRRFYVKYKKGLEGRFYVEDGWEHHF